MRAGLHTASFRVDRLTEGDAIVGVVQAGKVDTTAPLDEFDALAGSVFNDSTRSWGWKASEHKHLRFQKGLFRLRCGFSELFRDFAQDLGNARQVSTAERLLELHDVDAKRY